MFKIEEECQLPVSQLRNTTKNFDKNTLTLLLNRNASYYLFHEMQLNTSRSRMTFYL